MLRAGEKEAGKEQLGKAQDVAKKAAGAITQGSPGAVSGPMPKR